MYQLTKINPPQAFSLSFLKPVRRDRDKQSFTLNRQENRNWLNPVN